MTAPIATTGRYSVVDLRRAWYIACASGELGNKPLHRRICDVPLVLFRTRGNEAVALLDRCAHRNVPLSGGRVVDGMVECPYHGWRFGKDGGCRLVPALPGEQEGKARRVPSYPIREQQGYVWIWLDADSTPTVEPYRFPLMGSAGYETIDYSYRFKATVHATAENALDVPHTAFLHKGLFRGGKQNPITAVVRRSATGVEANYQGEPRPGGVLGRILAPGGGTVEHFDRFLLPSICEVEYRLGGSHLFISSALTPVTEFDTVMFAVTSVKLPLGAASLVKRILLPFALKVVRQDAEILAQQTDAVRAFGGEQYVNTPVDVLGPHILRLLKEAERGDAPRDDVVEERVELLA